MQIEKLEVIEIVILSCLIIFSLFLLLYLSKGEKIMNRGTRKRSTVGLIFDFVLTICTGGLWLVWIVIRYLRNNS